MSTVQNPKIFSLYIFLPLLLNDWNFTDTWVSYLIATLLPSITMGLRTSSSSLVSSLFGGDVTVTGSSMVGPGAWMSSLGTSTDIVTGPRLAFGPAPILTSSPRTLSVSMLGPNFFWTAWTCAVEYPSLWKKSSWDSRWCREGSGSPRPTQHLPGSIILLAGRDEFWTWGSEEKIHAAVSVSVRFRELVLEILLHGCTAGKKVTPEFISSSSQCSLFMFHLFGKKKRNKCYCVQSVVLSKRQNSLLCAENVS